jgi:hypothetical protein
MAAIEIFIEGKKELHQYKTPSTLGLKNLSFINNHGN